MGNDVIIALDFDSKEKTLAFLDRFTGEKPFVKIGMELFYAEGPQVVRDIRARGHKIFLDLKLHDIPNTVRKAMAVLSRLDVDMCNVHAAGTIAAGAAAMGRPVNILLQYWALDAFRVLEVIYVLTFGGPGDSTEILALHIYKTAFVGQQLGVAAAMSVLLLAVVAALSWGALRLSNPMKDDA